MDSKASLRRQICSALFGNLLIASAGASNGWATVNFVDLQKDDTLFPSGPLSLSQVTFIISVSSISAIIGNLVFPYIVTKFGSKRTMFALGFPQILTWLLIIYAPNRYFIYASSAVAGIVFAGAMICIPLFVTEICNDEIRGALNALFDTFLNLGGVFAFLLGKYFNYVDQAKFHLILSIAYVILFARIPDSPQHLIYTQRQKAAYKAQEYFKGTELESLPVNEAKDTEDNSEVTFSDFTNHRARKAFFIGFSLICLNGLQGFVILVTYVTEIFATSNPNISPIDASIIITTILIISNLIFLNVVDRAGRRTFYICSSIATTIGLVLFALYLYFLMNIHAFDWVPIVCLSYVLFVSSLGMNPVPLLIVIEIFPRKIKHYGFSVCVTLVLVNTFILLETYPPIKEHIGLFGWIAFFATASLWNALFGLMFLPETRGKSHEAIMRLLDK